MDLLHGVGEFFAIDIGTNAMRLVQLSGNAQSGWALNKFAYVPVDAKVMQDESDAGKKRKGEAILGAVNQAGIKTKNVALGLPAKNTYTAVIEVPNLPIEELKKTIKYEIDQYIPMAVDEAEVDYVILGQSLNDPQKAEVLLSSTAQDYAEKRMEMLESLGLNVIAQEPEPIAMARSLSTVGFQGAQMIIDLGEESADLVVVYQGAPRLVRSIRGGMSAMVRTAAHSLSVREDQARQFILKFGLAQNQMEGQVFKALDVTLENFAQEMTKSAHFFQNKYSNTPVSQIVLSGFAGMIPLMSEYIEAKTSIPTAQGNPWQRVKMTPQQQQMLATVGSEFAVAIGLAERGNDNV